MFDFLPTPHPLVIAGGGLLMLAVTVVQMLVGYRKIRFKGRMHLKVHKVLAWVLIAGTVLHALAGMLYLGIIG